MGGPGTRRRLVLFGAPGSGKGTQAEILRKRYQLDHIAPGDMLREHRAAGTELGQLASEYMAAGKLVPDELIVNMIRRRLEESRDGHGFVLDGFPRTVPQAKALQELLTQLDSPIDLVAVLEVPEEALVGRLSRRSEEERREDDTPEIIAERLHVYRDQTAPVLDYFGDHVPVVRLDATGSIDEVNQALVQAIG